MSRLLTLPRNRWPNGPDPAELRRLAESFARRGLTPPGAIDQQWLVFRGLELRGKAVLDVGAGEGLTSAYAAACGATPVVALEPEAAGSSMGASEAASALHKELGYESRITILEEPLETAPIGRRFDVVVVNAAINHFDEESCARLHDDPEARAAYRPFLSRLAELCEPGGRLIMVDCSNRNVFPDLGLRNPIMNSIEWRIHQPPEVWAKLLAEVGFHRLKIEWLPLTRKFGLGRVLSNPRVAYLLNSMFRLEMEKARPDQG